MKKHKRRLIFVLVLALISTYLFFEMTQFAPNRYKLRIETVQSEKIPEQFNNVSIAFFSDIYGDTEHLKQAIESINDFNPDIIIFNGNLFDTIPTEEQGNEYTELFKSMKSKLGKFAVLGNKDYELSFETSQNILNKADFRVLSNQALTIHNGDDARIKLTGLDSNTLNKESLDSILTEDDSELFDIVFAHNPDIIDSLSSNYIDLFLAGKSLGGRVVIPFVGPILDSPKHYKRISKVNDTPLIITSGLGLDDPELRLFSNPETVIVVLKSDNKN